MTLRCMLVILALALTAVPSIAQEQEEVIEKAVKVIIDGIGSNSIPYTTVIQKDSGEAIDLSSINNTVNNIYVFSNPSYSAYNPATTDIGTITLGGSLQSHAVYVMLGAAPFPDAANADRGTPAARHFGGLTTGNLQSNIRFAGTIYGDVKGDVYVGSFYRFDFDGQLQASKSL